MKMPSEIRINGVAYKVLNAYSCGPGAPLHTFDLQYGYVYEIAGKWHRQLPGNYPYEVKVEIPTPCAACGDSQYKDICGPCDEAWYSNQEVRQQGSVQS